MLYGVELIDKIAAARGVEARLPFCDRRLLEFALSLPTDQKQRLGWDRFVLRQAMEGSLPEAIQWRRDKGDLGANARRGFYQEREKLEQVLDHSDCIGEYVDRVALQAAYARFVADPYQSSDSGFFAVLVAYTLAEWLARTGLQT
jgi:asparagine synthase (glutamine-hydrolysing)